MADAHENKLEGKDCAEELKSVRKRRAELASETGRLEERLSALKAREATAQEAERAKRALEAEKKLLAVEERRARELSEQLKRDSPHEQAQARQNGKQSEKRAVEIGAKSNAEELDASYPYSFLIARRFFGVDEFTRAEKREKDVVSKTRKLVGM